MEGGKVLVLLYCWNGYKKLTNFPEIKMVYPSLSQFEDYEIQYTTTKPLISNKLG
jgi:hypothetical protein